MAQRNLDRDLELWNPGEFNYRWLDPEDNLNEY